jgi:hypothetical protein
MIALDTNVLARYVAPRRNQPALRALAGVMPLPSVIAES